MLPEATSPAVRPGWQMALPMGDDDPPRAWREVLPAVVHVPDWLDPTAQRGLVEDFRRWARPPAGLRHPRVPTGQLMSVQSVCLGWHWQPYAYTHTADDTDGAPVKSLPEDLIELARAAVGAAYGEGGVMPAMANRTSEAFRIWHVDAEGAPRVLVAAVRAADAEGVAWSNLYCSGPSVVFDGHKRLVVDGKTIVADAEVRIDLTSAIPGMHRTDLDISLSSDGAETVSSPPPDDQSPSIGDPCPSELTALLAELGS